MKIQLNTTEKTIKIEEKVNLGELFLFLNQILPDLWREFSIETNSSILWCDPIKVEPWFYPSYPWWREPIITYGGTGDVDNNSLNGGIYCIEF